LDLGSGALGLILGATREMRRRLVSTLLTSLSLLVLIGAPSHSNAKTTTIYYYNPDSNLTDYAGLKRTADGFLREVGDFQFQPFRDANVFDMHTLMNSDGITILPSWKYKSMEVDRAGFLTLWPHWVGTKSGVNSEARIVVSLNTKPVRFDSKIKIASSIGSSQCMRLLVAAFPNEPIADVVEIVSVPRDSDAGFAVLFEEADAAVVTERTVSMITPRLRDSGERLIEWAKTAPVLSPVVVADENDAAAQKYTAELFAEMAVHPKGKELLDLLGLDGWQAFTGSELRFFEDSGGD